MKNKRVIISAYACEPKKGTEQGVGWNWVLQLSRIVEVIVITRANNREVIESEISKELEGRIRFVYYDLPHNFRRFKRRERGLYAYYFFWQWGAYKLAKRLLAEHPADYVMHLTFGSIWLPTFMHLLPAKFIWGPVGGGEAVPLPLIGSLPLKSRFIQYLRYFLMASLGINPLFLGPANRAKLILTRTNDTARIIPARFKFKTRTVLETAAAEDWFNSLQAQHRDKNWEPIRAIYTGRLVAFKNLEMAIRAVANARSRGMNIEFLIVGDGPLKKSLSLLAEQLDISDFVTFAGRQTPQEVIRLLSESDIYLFPSLREGGTWSLMEAMAVGLPSICVRTSGMAVIADPSCARMIDPTAPETMIKSFSDALCDLAKSSKTRKKMGDCARARLETKFKWSQKAEFMETFMQQIDNGII